jgi:hypothetical protein
MSELEKIGFKKHELMDAKRIAQRIIGKYYSEKSYNYKEKKRIGKIKRVDISFKKDFIIDIIKKS